MLLAGKGILLGQEPKVSQKTGTPYVIVRIAEESGKVFEMLSKPENITVIKQFENVNFFCEVTQGKYTKFECIKLEQVK